jgi:PAS domain S-box-containing protein
VENRKAVVDARTDYIHRLWEPLSEGSPVGLVALEGPTLVIRYANPAFARLAGTAIDEIIGRPFADVVPGGISDELLALLHRVFGTGHDEWLEEQCHARQPPAFWSYAAWRMPDGDQRPGGILLQVTDATRAALLRKRLVEMNERLASSAAELQELTKVQDSVKARDRFLATLSHEIRNPLNVLSAGIQTLKLAGNDAELVANCLGVLERQVKQMSGLLDDLLDVHRLTMGTLEVHKKRVDIASILRDAVAMSRPSIDRGAHPISVSVPPEPVMLTVDPARLRQAVINLLHNAVKFSEPGQPIHLSLVRTETDVLIRLRDSGTGIEADQLPRIFDLFQQVDSEWTGAQGGLGIGLALARKYVELHGGRIVARSEGPGKGSEFLIELSAEAASTAGRKSPVAPRGQPHVTGQRILVVEDNVDAARSLASLLQFMKHDVRTAHDGTEGVAAAAAFHPDVILMDLGMPHVDGVEAARRIRAEPWGKETAIIALTGWARDDDRRRTREAGFDRHLLKPVDIDVLVSLIDELAGNPN